MREAAARLFEVIREVMVMESPYPDSLQEARLIDAEKKLVDAIRLDTGPPPPPPRRR
jgi:hypothetical protein